MKIGGMEVKGLNEVVCVIPRTNGDIVIKTRAIPDYVEFDKLVPEPTAPVILKADGSKRPETDNADFLAAIAQREILRIAYIYIKSLEPSQVEWDTVDVANPQTWLNYRPDLVAAGFSPAEMMRIWNAIAEANCLDEDKLIEARNRFLLGREVELQASSSQNTAQASTQSGVPASVSA